MLKCRIINFENLIANVEDFRIKKEKFKYNSFLNKFPNGNKKQDCAICSLNINPYAVYTKNEVAVCIECFNKFLDNEAYLQNIKAFKIKVATDNTNLTLLINSINKKENIAEEKLNATFAAMSLKEIEYYIGLPNRYGSFDHGLESGFWSIDNINVEIWFQDLICISVDLR